MARQSVNLFTQHSRHWRANRYVYPVVSRRSRGLSIGVNLNPDKICNFNCIYCCVDRSTMPGRSPVDRVVLRAELDHILELVVSGAIWTESPFDGAAVELKRLNDVAFSGDGEPTSFQEFGAACRLVASSIADRGLTDTKIVVITNATLFHQKRVQEGLAFLDAHQGEIWAKLDAGTEGYYDLVERTRVPFRQVLDNILAAGRIRPIVIQSLFMKVHGAPPPEQEIAEYVQRLRNLRDAGCRVKLVQVYTTARQTAERFVSPLDERDVDRIVAAVGSLGLPAEGYYGSG